MPKDSLIDCNISLRQAQTDICSKLRLTLSKDQTEIVEGSHPITIGSIEYCGSVVTKWNISKQKTKAPKEPRVYKINAFATIIIIEHYAKELRTEMIESIENIKAP